jgi:hypothetical protein
LVRQKDSGLQNLELRSGVKLKNIFFLRTAIAVVILYSLFLINLIFYTIIWSLGEIPTIVTEQNIYPIYGFLFLFIIIIYGICNLIFATFRIAIASSVASLIMILGVVAPMIPSIKYHESQDTLTPLIRMQEIASANEKISLGQRFLNFIEDNSEYEWLLDDFSLLSYVATNEVFIEPTCSPNDPMCHYSGWGSNVQSWLSGLWLGTSKEENVLEDSMKVLMNDDNPWAASPYQRINKRMPKYFDFARKLNSFIEKNKIAHQENVAENETYMFSSRQDNHTGVFSNKKNNLGLFISDLSNMNFTFENVNYNKLFLFLKENANAIVQYNELNHNVGETIPGLFESTGTIFPYAYASSNNNFQRIFGYDSPYSNTMLPSFFWYLGQNIHYAMTLDNNELKVFNTENYFDHTASTNLIINPLAQLQFLASGKNYHNNLMTDIFNVNGEFLNLYNNNYLSVNLSNEVQNINSNRGFNYDVRFNPVSSSDVNETNLTNSEIYNVQIKQHQYVSYEAMYIVYGLFFGSFVYASYQIFKFKFRK